MKFKPHVILALLPIFFVTKSYSQNLSGTWDGLYGIGQNYINHEGMSYRFAKDSLYMHLEILQEGRKIYGVFYYSNNANEYEPLAMCQISGLLDKKNPLNFFKLNREEVMQDHTDPKMAIKLFWSLPATYCKSDSAEIIYGNWYPGRGKAGAYWVKKKNSFIGPL